MKEPAPRKDTSGEHISRVRRLCMALQGTTEKVSHGAPTFFLKQGVYLMFVDNHHDDGHIAVWLATDHGTQQALIKSDPKKYYRPPYVGVSGWVGVDLREVDDEELGMLVVDAWRMIAAKKKSTARKKK